MSSNLPLRNAPRQRRRRRNAVHENMPGFDQIHGSITQSRQVQNPYKAKKRASADQCPICLKDYSENEEVVFLDGPDKPKHTMCVECFSNMKDSPNPDKCPICRAQIYTVQSSFGSCVYLQRVKLKKKTKSSFGNKTDKDKLFRFLKSKDSSNPKAAKKNEIKDLYISLGESIGYENIVDKDGSTVFDVTKNSDMLQHFMRNTPNLSSVINKGHSPLMFQMSKNSPNFNILKDMVLLGADPNFGGTTPIEYVIGKYKTSTSPFVKQKFLEFILKNSVSVINYPDILNYAKRHNIKKAIDIIEKHANKQKIQIKPVQTFDLSGIADSLPDTRPSVKRGRRNSLDMRMLEDVLPKVSRRKIKGKKSNTISLKELREALPSKDPFELNDLSSSLPPIKSKLKRKKQHRNSVRKKSFKMDSLADALPDVKQTFDLGSLDDALPKTTRKSRKSRTPTRRRTSAAPLRRSKRIAELNQKKKVDELDNLMASLGMAFGRPKKPSDNKKRTIKKKTNYGRKKKPSDNKKRAKPASKTKKRN